MKCQTCSCDFEQKRKSVLFCSKSCAAKNPDRQGKREATLLKRLGPGWKGAIEKKRLDSLEKTTGSRSPFGRHEVREKSKSTLRERYGVEHNSSIRKKNLNKEELSSLYSSGLTCREMGEKLGVGRTCIESYMHSHELELRKTSTQSRHEREITDHLRSLSIEFSTNDRRIITPKELDIFVPSRALAVEVNGLYWHSESRVGKFAHLNKRKLCEEKGIRLIQIWDREIECNPSLIKSLIERSLGFGERIAARKCSIVELSSKISNAFLNRNHLQGGAHSKVRLGLTHEGDLIGVMTFGKPRFNKNVDWELIRVAFKTGFSVIGGSRKLFSRFLKSNSGSVISYCDLRFFQGGVYDSLGFEKTEESPPGYFYYSKSDHSILSRYACQKHKLKKFPEFSPELTESDIMGKLGFERVWDAGQSVHIFRN